MLLVNADFTQLHKRSVTKFSDGIDIYNTLQHIVDI